MKTVPWIIGISHPGHRTQKTKKLSELSELEYCFNERPIIHNCCARPPIHYSNRHATAAGKVTAGNYLHKNAANGIQQIFSLNTFVQG